MKTLIFASVMLALAASALALSSGAAPPKHRENAEKLWEPIGRVVTHPRCSNCHSSTNFPRQHDTRDAHQQNVTRGADNHGPASLRCATCHQKSNSGEHGFVPGTPNWQMPSVAMGWDGLTSAQICKAITTPSSNGNRKTAKEIVEHMYTDPLVHWAWAPGGNRTTPPISYEEFVAALNKWEAAGAPCPTFKNVRKSA